MLLEQIKLLVESEKAQGKRNDYIINAIKEFLQIKILYYLYSNKKYNKLIFTGGTCLRFCFNLPRLSEDLDLDFENKLDVEALCRDIDTYLSSSLKIKNVSSVIKGKNKKIYIKFPILKDLSLSYGGSEILYIKIKPSKAPKAPQKIEVTPINREDLYFFIKHYSIADLMAGKIHAFLMRSFFKGKKNEIDFKGRDVFDLVWYMGKNIVPNIPRLKILLKETIYKNYNWANILEAIGKKLKNTKKQHITADILQFIEDRQILQNFLDNYLIVFEQYYKKYRQADDAS